MSRKKAVFTIVKNEKVFLPIWLKYYSKFFDSENIYVLNHNSTDGSIKENLKKFEFRTETLDNPTSFDHTWLLEQVKKKQKELLNIYEYVLFAEADEIILPDYSKFNGLSEYINKFRKDCISCLGYEIIQMRDEMPINLNKTILSQRKFWFRRKRMDKPLLSKIPLDWIEGFHSAANCRETSDDLYLVHLHRFDYQLALKKNEENLKLTWSEKDVRKGRGWQNRLLGKDFDKFFYEYGIGRIEQIPDELRRTDVF